MQWIKEIETAKSIDDLITPRSTLGRTDFPDYDELDAMMASALRKLFDWQTHFRKKVSVEEQRAQNNDRLKRGRQIAFMIYDHFRSIGTAAFKILIYAGNQQFLSTSDPPADKILEGLYKSKLQDSTQLQTFLAQYNQETI